MHPAFDAVPVNEQHVAVETGPVSDHLAVFAVVDTGSGRVNYLKGRFGVVVPKNGAIRKFSKAIMGILP